MNVFVKIVISILVVSIVFTLYIGIYMAQPWGDNYAYQNVFGYIFLVIFMLFAISPYLGLVLLIRIFRKYRAALIGFLIGVSLISLFGMYALIDTAFIHIDAQGALIFIFLPILQWFALIILTAICFFLRRFNNTNA